MCLNTGTPKNINFSFETNGKFMALGVPILKYIQSRRNLSSVTQNVLNIFAISKEKNMSVCCIFGKSVRSS